MLGRLKNGWNKQRTLKLLRYLRIAVSTFFGIVCLLMIAWWVRSYWWTDHAALRLSRSEYVQVLAGDARMCVWFEHRPTKTWFVWWSDPITVHTPPDPNNRIPWFDLHAWPTFIRVYTAHGFLAVLAGSFAILLWCPRRFSLRGLLIATTFIAAITGTIAWVDKNF
jgi:hypothetical protein